MKGNPMLTDRDTSIITQVAFKGAIDAQTMPLNTSEGQAEFGHNFSFLRDILFDMVDTDGPTPQAAANVIHAQFPGTVEVSSPAHTSTLTVKGTQHGPLPDWLYTQAAAVGVTEVWDNRDRLAAAQAQGKKPPHFRSAHDAIDKAFWPPRAA